MAGILQSLEIARKALWASQTGLDITSNNIANVNTPGYSRQRVELTPSTPVNLGFGPIGTGVLAKRITRARFSLVDQSIRDAYSEHGFGKAQETILMQLDGIFNEPGENGLAYLITDFFNEWSNVAANPEDASARQMLLQKSMKMASAFRDTTNKIYTMKKNIETQVDGDLSELNGILKEIVSLNRKIVNAEVGGAQANNLRDERDLLLDKLSAFGKVHAVEDSRGSMNVSLEGVTLVSGTDYQQLEYKVETDGTGRKRLHYKLKSTGETFNAKKGKLGSYTYQFNELLPSQQEKLDQMAKTIIEQVNKIHSKSYGLPQGNPPVASTGLNFFGGGSAGTIQVNPNIAEDVSKIALSVSGEPGDAEAALAIANIVNQKLFGNHTQTISEFYQSMVSELGFKIDEAQSTVHHQELLISQLESQRDSISGVNLDEEMINLTRFQRAFEAASKVVKTVDEMMQTIINMK
jgi:flagellar hook-associated protein 1 FlgK